MIITVKLLTTDHYLKKKNNNIMYVDQLQDQNLKFYLLPL